MIVTIATIAVATIAVATIAVATIAAILAIVAIIWKPLLRSLRSLRSYGNHSCDRCDCDRCDHMETCRLSRYKLQAVYHQWQKRISFPKQEDFNCDKCCFLFFDAKKFTDNGIGVCSRKQKKKPHDIRVPLRVKGRFFLLQTQGVHGLARPHGSKLQTRVAANIYWHLAVAAYHITRIL